MARRRGLGNSERLALDLSPITTTGAVIAVPSFVYSLDASLTDTNETELFNIADSTSTANTVKYGQS